MQSAPSKDKLKILIISDAWHPQVNGVVRTYEHLQEELTKKGHDVKVIGPCDFKWTIGLIGYSEIRLALFAYTRLSAMIKNYAPDVIHIAVEGPLGWAARKYCVRYGIDFSTSYHTHFPHYLEKRVPRFLPFLKKPARKIGRWYVRTFHAPAHFMMVASPGLEEDLRAWQFKNQIQRLTRGINTDVFYPGEGSLFKGHRGPIALYVGRVAIEKNLEKFLQMSWEGTKVIVGDGPSKHYLEQKYPAALFVGQKSGAALADHYRSSDVFVFPSRTDTFGIVILEALGCGLPVAAYPVTGPKDIITEDYLGCLNKDLSIAAKSALSCGEPKYRVKFVKTHYSWAKAANQFLKTFLKS